jgi:NAD+ diphosphatase
VFHFRGREVYIARDEENHLQLPQYGELADVQRKEDLQYLFSVGKETYFLLKSKDELPQANGYAYETVRTLRQLVSKEVCFAVMTAYHLYMWYRDNGYCGRCGGETVHDTKERMLRCPTCGNMIFPKIAPAVIVALTDGERILMTKYADREYKKYALIAGFTEIGETVEETVAREVMEEVGLKVKNVRYYKSQPWGVDSNLLLGFFAELDGDDTIHRDETELAEAEWFERNAMPAHDDGISLTREMMGVFERGEW